jgi:uncharacterized membrane protein YebE (DUF533 family)
MSGKGLLDQLFKSGQDLLNPQRPGDQRPGEQSPGGLMDSLGGLLNQKAGGAGVLDNLAGMFKDKEGNSQLGSFLAGAGGGALAGSALSLLLGNKHSRELVGNVLTYGGLAAVGAIAYKAYGNWQARQGAGAPLVEPQTLDRLAPALAEERSRALLLAMVTAAKADGHIDQRERNLLTQSISNLGGGAAFKQWLAGELDKPLDPGAVARTATSPEMAAELYIASVLVVDEEHFLERAYLDELARQLGLAPGLKTELEQQVRLELAQGRQLTVR